MSGRPVTTRGRCSPCGSSPRLSPEGGPPSVCARSPGVIRPTFTPSHEGPSRSRVLRVSYSVLTLVLGAGVVEPAKVV